MTRPDQIDGNEDGPQLTLESVQQHGLEAHELTKACADLQSAILHYQAAGYPTVELEQEVRVVLSRRDSAVTRLNARYNGLRQQTVNYEGSGFFRSLYMFDTPVLNDESVLGVAKFHEFRVAGPYGVAIGFIDPQVTSRSCWIPLDLLEELSRPF